MVVLDLRQLLCRRLRDEQGHDDVYVPFTLGMRPIDRLWLSLTLPYIYQSVGGRRRHRRRSGQAKARRRWQVRGARAFHERKRSRRHAAPGVLRRSRGRELIPEIAPYVKIKFPTADSDRGLGTGEFDETIGVDLSKAPHRSPVTDISPCPTRSSGILRTTDSVTPSVGASAPPTP